MDEAGRGPLAGRVYAAAVILNPDKPIIGLADSKILSQNKREELYLEIISKSPKGIFGLPWLAQQGDCKNRVKRRCRIKDAGSAFAR
mgnify:CR=1 FL=1